MESQRLDYKSLRLVQGKINKFYLRNCPQKTAENAIFYREIEGRKNKFNKINMFYLRKCFEKTAESVVCHRESSAA